VISLVLLAFLQGFTPDLPPTIPKVDGSPKEAAVFRYIDTVPGTGDTARPGQKYRVHYTGWLRDGKKFDSSVDRNEPFESVQGRRQVIAGWEAGFEGMKVGGKRRLFVPYQMAYGEKGSAPVIPAKAELIFDVELLGVTDVPETPPAADILLAFDRYKGQVLQLAKAIPEDKYNWRPAPGVRSTAEVFAHIALGVELMVDIALEQPAQEELKKRFPGQRLKENEARSKAQTISLLEQYFAAARKRIEPLRAGMLGRDASFFGQPTTVRGILAMADAHIAEHLGQLIAYARMNGIVPPWSN
jgi:uncharacterized damage-inducible protein DinB